MLFIYLLILFFALNKNKEIYRPVEEDLQTEKIPENEDIVLNEKIIINNESENEDITIQISQNYNLNRSPDPIIHSRIINLNTEVMQYHRDREII
ncbi:hypothetical protein GVAV_000730 [Gurleya vavrai]